MTKGKFKTIYGWSKIFMRRYIIMSENCNDKRATIAHHSDKKHNNNEFENISCFCMFCHKKIHRPNCNKDLKYKITKNYLQKIKLLKRKKLEDKLK